MRLTDLITAEDFSEEIGLSQMPYHTIEAEVAAAVNGWLSPFSDSLLRYAPSFVERGIDPTVVMSASLTVLFILDKIIQRNFKEGGRA